MPLGGIELQLWRRGSPDFLPVEWVGGIDDRGFTNPDGTFSLTATDSEDNRFVRMALLHRRLDADARYLDDIRPLGRGLHDTAGRLAELPDPDLALTSAC